MQLGNDRWEKADELLHKPNWVKAAKQWQLGYVCWAKAAGQRQLDKGSLAKAAVQMQLDHGSWAKAIFNF